MPFSELLRLVVDADTRGAVRDVERLGQTSKRELSKSEQQLDRWGNRLTSVGAGLLTLGSVAAYGLGRAAQSASDLGEAVNASNVVFGDAVGIIDEYARDSATSVGLSERAFREATTQMGAQLKNLGFSTEDAASASVELTQRAADMASVFNTDVSQATQAIGAALRGERDPIERFGVTINEAAVKAEAMRLGLAGATGELSLNAKALATQSLILEQTNDIAGDFANTADSMANKQRAVSAQFEDLKASIGEAALPAIESLLGAAQRGIGIFKGLNEATGGFLGQAATWGTVASLGIGGLSLIAGQAIKARNTLRDMRDAVSGLTGRLGGLRSAAGIAAGAAGIAGLAVAVDQMQKAARGREIGRLQQEFLATGDAAKILDKALSGDLRQVQEGIGAFGALAESNEVAAERILDQAEAAGYAEDKVAALRAILDESSAANAQAAEDAQATAGAMGDQAEATDLATSALQSYVDELAAQFDPLFAYESALASNAAALRDEADAQQALSDLRSSGTATAEEIAEAERRLEDAHRDVQSSAVDLAGDEAALFDSIDSGGTDVEKLRRMLDELEAQNYLSAASAADLRAKIDAIESRTVDVRLRSNARNTARTVQTYIDGIRGREVFVSVVETFAGTKRLTRKQHGGPVRAGEPYIVGETQPELFVPDRDGTIVASVPGPASTSAWSGGATYVDNRTINITTGADPQSVVAALRRAKDLGMPVSVSGRQLL